MAALVSRLSRQRLVTVVGPGGIGKTTVALAVAERMIAAMNTASGWSTWRRSATPAWCRARLRPCSVWKSALKIRFPRLVAALRDNRMLLLLDNCEHVIDAVASLAAAVLGGAPGVTFWRPAGSRSGCG